LLRGVSAFFGFSGAGFGSTITGVCAKSAFSTLWLGTFHHKRLLKMLLQAVRGSIAENFMRRGGLPAHPSKSDIIIIIIVVIS
jgi:hypothetical protein